MFDALINWRAWLVVFLISGLTLISSVAKYHIGEKGLEAIEKHFPQVEPERWERIGSYFQRWGSPLVVISFLPVLGTLIPTAAGAFGIPFRPFLVFAFIAKVVRYWILFLFFFGGALYIFS